MNQAWYHQSMKYYSIILQKTVTDACTMWLNLPGMRLNKVDAYRVHLHKFTKEQNLSLVVKIRRVVGKK